MAMCTACGMAEALEGEELCQTCKAKTGGGEEAAGGEEKSGEEAAM